MGVYVVRRLVVGVIVVGIVSIVAFLGLELAPGDELTARLGPDALAQLSQPQIQERRHELGLDQPLPVRYLKWVEGAVRGDLGYSSGDAVPVTDDLRQHLGPTLLLLGVAMLVGTIVALTLGIVAALRQHTATDYVLGSLPILLIAIPGFVLALAVIYLFSVYLHLLPTSGMHALGDESVGDLLRHLVLPASVLAIGFAAPLLRYTRASMIEALSADYMVAARAKGLPARTIVLRHGLRNALLPIITVIGLSLPDMVAGAVITEQVFGWPGMGQLAVRAAGNRDVAMMMGVVLLVAIVVTLANLVTDLAYARADPRVRLG
jgi:ABC-type dipeptide/oligopeptide/nickel transport system permease component